MRTSRLFRTAAAGTLLAVLAGCGSSGAHPAGGPETPPPPSTAPAADPSAPASAPGASGVPGFGIAGSGTPESVTAALAALPENLRKRVPQFPPAPLPVKVSLPPATDGKAAFFSRIPTTEKIAFITIDDGWEKNPLALQLFQAANVPQSLFLEVNAIKDNPGFFLPLQTAGATIENHTITHATMTRLSLEGQKREICGGADKLAAYYGTRPTLFRPPGGSWNNNTLRAAHACGMKAVFTWTQTTDHGKLFYQNEEKVIYPGDIILMHFRPRFVDDYLAVLKAIHKNGLTPARLEDYIP
ncbi:polysaccharide deacetylase family protein [Actinoplanes palleronii]|uniref:polysaccharide deacetylase family protein n=1 Tax=Actinoplanes palleronii TaxID=113570 RepID=UPI001942749C|nr:polysaccharide deacetylase family protein [Actinoplanes palleronii]